ncbi:MAG: tRNA (adenosine(37)-N6)-threonylcarbamoyltransferase complex dimerization subunit type 1 TsaB [Pseudomonadota bacterium]
MIASEQGLTGSAEPEIPWRGPGALLAIDATGPFCGVGVARADGVASVRCVSMERGHAERIFPLIEDSLAALGCGYDDVSRLAACRGPGSFTGVRIAVAAARGLALAIPGSTALGVDAFALHAEAARHAGVRGPVRVVFGAPPRQIARRFDLNDRAAEALADIPSGSAPDVELGPGAWDGPAGAEPTALMAALLRLAVSQGPEDAPATPFYSRAPDASPSQEDRPIRLGPRPRASGGA